MQTRYTIDIPTRYAIYYIFSLDTQCLHLELLRVVVVVRQVPLAHPHRELPGQETTESRVKISQWLLKIFVPLLVLVHGAVRGGDDVPVRDQRAPAPELPPAAAVQVDGRHPGHLSYRIVDIL